MRTILVFGLSAGIISLGTAGAGRAEDKSSVPSVRKGELRAEHVVGSWMIIGGERDGKPIPEDHYKSTQVVITRKQIKVEDNTHQKTWLMSYVLDPAKTPGEISMTLLDGKHKGDTAHGTFRLNGDRLTISYYIPAAVASPVRAEAGTPDSRGGKGSHMTFTMERTQERRATIPSK